jgi:hypothetical protein
LRHLVIVICAALAASVGHAEMIGGNPGPQYNYICPNADNKPALDCFFDAVAHLYTMCKHVKSIEIIEYGYDKSTEGTNGAKSESCVIKQKLNITRPYQAALKLATPSAKAVDGLRALYASWLQALADLAWKPGESDDAYKARTQHPYETFAAEIVDVQTSIQLAHVAAEQKKTAAADTKKAAAAKPKPVKKAAN